MTARPTPGANDLWGAQLNAWLDETFATKMPTAGPVTFPDKTATSNIALRASATDAVVYVSKAAAASDANDGLSWGTAKATIQAAINALPATGGVVRIGAGTYVVAEQNSPSGAQYIKCGLTVPSNVSLIGAGRRSTILTHGAIPSGAGETYFAMIVNSNPTASNQNIRVADIGMDLTYPLVTTVAPLGMSRYATGVYFAGVSHARVERCWIKNGSVGFIPGPTTIGTTASFDQNFDNVVCDCIMEDLTMSVFLYQGRQLRCERNWINRSWDDPILVGSAARDVWVRHNYVNSAPVEAGKGGSNGAIYVINDGALGNVAEMMDGLWITDNVVKDNLNRDATGGGALLGIGLSKACRNVWIERNTVSGCDRGIQMVDGNNRDVMIRGNSVHHNVKQGIRAQSNTATTGDVRGLAIEDNAVWANCQDGSTIGGIEVYCSTGSLTGVIARNHVYDDQGTPTQTTAIRVGAEPTSTVTWRIHDNLLVGTTATLASFGSTFRGCHIRNNSGYNPQGMASITVSASPFTYTAGPTPEVIYIRGGTVSSIVKSGVTLFATTDQTVTLDPGEAVTVTYSVAPTMVKDRR